ncbi:MAG TPA: sterol desaturase, partial [Vicinamibacteria bacterium]|nr:sterol desaturase [Vicinamibacteria bacterium]
MRYIVFAIPAFLALVAVEVLLVRRLGRSDYYSLPDSIADLGTGLLSQLFETGLKFAIFAGYVWANQSHRVLDVPLGSPAAWVLCFLGVDFLYYWFHRTSHERNA